MSEWDPSHEDPDEKTRKLRLEIEADIDTLVYGITGLVMCLFVPFVWIVRRTKRFLLIGEPDDC